MLEKTTRITSVFCVSYNFDFDLGHFFTFSSLISLHTAGMRHIIMSRRFRKQDKFTYGLYRDTASRQFSAARPPGHLVRSGSRSGPRQVTSRQHLSLGAEHGLLSTPRNYEALIAAYGSYATKASWRFQDGGANPSTSLALTAEIGGHLPLITSHIYNTARSPLCPGAEIPTLDCRMH